MDWRDLVVASSGGETIGSLADVVSDGLAPLDGIRVSSSGSLLVWHGFFVSSPGEDPEWDTPRGEVDWSGFLEAIQARN